MPRIGSLISLGLLLVSFPAFSTSAAGAAAGPGRAITAWGTPTLSDWNGVWRRRSGATGPDIIALPVVPTPLYAPFLQANLQARSRGLETSHVVRCLPAGMPFAASLVYPAEFIVRPNQVNIIYEIGDNRRIRINGTHPDYLEASFRGDSIGRWEGDTLVIDTVAINTRSVISGGARHSNQLRVTERMREISPGVIENHITLTDPVAFAQPVDYTVLYEKAADEVVQEQACEKNVEADELKILYDVFDTLPEPPQPRMNWATGTVVKE
jgi:hypothetical protein